MESVILAMAAAPSWHGAGAAQWRKMREITPHSYLCRRVDPAKPLSLADPDVRTAEAWAHAPWTEDFLDIEGDCKGRPCLQTRVRMLWDDDALYVGAWMQETCVVATLRERNSVMFQDNDFEVFIDAHASNHNYYEMEVNALNTIWELRLDKPYKNGGSEHSERVGMVGEGNLPNLHTAVTVEGSLNDAAVDDVGWGVVAKIPFADLTAAGHCLSAPAPLDSWRINFSRVQWAWEWKQGLPEQQGTWVKLKRTGHGNEGEDNWTWTAQGVINMHCPERWGFLRFCPPGEHEYHHAWSETEQQEWSAREALMCWHYLLEDWRAAHPETLPPTLDALQAGEMVVGLEAQECGLEVRPDLTGGYLAFVRLATGRRLCVRGDALLWTE